MVLISTTPKIWKCESSESSGPKPNEPLNVHAYWVHRVRTGVKKHKATKWIRIKPKPTKKTRIKPKHNKRSQNTIRDQNISHLPLVTLSPTRNRSCSLYPNLGFPLSLSLSLLWLSDPRNPNSRIRYNCPPFNLCLLSFFSRSSFSPCSFFDFCNFRAVLCFRRPIHKTGREILYMIYRIRCWI